MSFSSAIQVPSTESGEGRKSYQKPTLRAFGQLHLTTRGSIGMGDDTLNSLMSMPGLGG